MTLSNAQPNPPDPTGMLRVVALLAAPVHDPQRPDHPPAPLDLQAEWRRLEQAVRASQAPVLLTRLVPPTLDRLRRELSPRMAEQGRFPHILHFSGHAWTQGLLLEDEVGQCHHATTQELLEAIQPPQPLDLVVLNACQTAAEARSVAQALVDVGLARAVIGHTRPVRDDQAIDFARTLYAELTDGYPVSQAVDRAQRHITTHQVLLLGEQDLAFEGLIRGEPVAEDGRPQGKLPSGDRVGFFGRGPELVTLARHLDKPPRVVLISGPEGMGKSRLALEAAHRNAWRFPGGAASAQAPQEQATADALLARLADALGLARTGEEAERALLDAAQARPTLLLLDNLESLPPAELARLARFLAQLRGPSAVLATLRPALERLEDLNQAVSLPLHRGLDLEPAAGYAQTLARSKGLTLGGQEAREIAQATAGHPLLIGQIVARARRRDRQALLAEVRRHEGDFAAQVDAVYAWSGARIGEAGRRAWQALPLFPAGRAPEGPLRALAGAEGTAALRQAAVADFHPRLQGWRWHPTAAEYAARAWPLDPAQARQCLVATLPAWREWLTRLGDEAPAARHARLEEALANLEPLVEAARSLGREVAGPFLRALDRALPAPDRTLALRAIQEPLYRALAELAQDEAEKARALHMLGWALSELGRLPSALQATQEAVALRRKLVQVNPQAFAPDLARSLNNLGAHLSVLGRRQEALQATQEAVDLYRELAQAQPQAFTPDLALSLNNLGAFLSALGRRQEALQATQEAVELRRKLAQANPQAFAPHLAASLNNLGSDLSALGRRQEALQATQEAVGLHRELAQAQPDAFTPHLAGSLHNLGGALSALGRRQEALQATQEAVALSKELAQAQPDAFTPHLALSLTNLGRDLSALGRRQEALQATQEAVELYKKLAQAQPDAFTPDLALSLHNLGSDLSALGRREEALQATQEAVGLYRELAQANPQAFAPDLALSLNNLGSHLSELGRREEALQAAQEAVALRRELAQANPQAFTPDLARSLTNLGRDLSALGRRQEALQATQEAVALYRELAQAQPDAFTPELAASLTNLGLRLSELGRRQEALQPTQEAVELLTPFFLQIPQAFAHWMGIFLRNYLDNCQALGVELDPALVGPVVAKLKELSDG